MRTTIFSLLVLSAFAIGCSSKPSELRNLSPVTITVLKDGQPLSDVEVRLLPRQDIGIWACSGRTDGSGVASVTTTLRTHFAPGARAATYAVILNKQPELPPELAPTAAEISASLSEQESEVLNAKRTAFVEKNRIIPKTLESEATTPIELVVTENNSVTLTIDVAKY